MRNCGLILLFSMIVLVAHAAPCNDVFTTLASFRSNGCLKSRNITNEERKETLSVLTNFTLLYAFTDMSIPTDDLMYKWGKMYDTPYESAFDFHKDIAITINKLYDYNTIYSLPSEYSSFQIMRLVGVVLSVDRLGEPPSVWTVPGALVLNDSDYYQFCNCSDKLSSFFYRKLHKINGVDPVVYLNQWSARVSTYRSNGSRFNDVLGSDGKFASFSITYIDEVNDYDTFEFADTNTSHTIPLAVGLVDYSKRHLSNSDTNNLKASASKDKNSMTYPFVKSLSDTYLRSASWIDNVSLPVGNISEYNVLAHYPGITYAIYKGTPILKITSFDPMLNDDGGWTRIVQLAVANLTNDGHSDNLILDLSKSSGNSPCLAYWLLSYLVQPWRGAPFNLNDVLYSPIDFRKSLLTDTLRKYGIFQASRYVDPSTGRHVSSDWYASSMFYTRGGVTSAYTKKFYFAGCQEVLSRLPWAERFFNKVLIITDGRCVGACAQFVDKMKVDDRARVMAYGGIPGKPTDLDPAPNAGGGIIFWQDWVRTVVKPISGINLLPLLPTSAGLSFVFEEVYSSLHSDVPREYSPSFNPDFMIETWKPFDGSLQSIVDLYEAALQKMPEIPGGLTKRDNLIASWLTPLTLAVLVIAGIFVVVCILGIVVCLYKQINFNYQMLDTDA